MLKVGRGGGGVDICIIGYKAYKKIVPTMS